MRKQTAAVALIAILVATAWGIFSLFRFTSTGVSTSPSATQISTSTWSHSPTIDQRLFKDRTVALDPSLQVGTAQSTLVTDNATEIAQNLASTLNELPVTLASEEPPRGPNDTINAFQATWHYRTAKDSTIQITFLFEDNRWGFYELDYRVKDYLNLTSGSSTSSFNTFRADQRARLIMSGLGISLTRVTLLDRVPRYLSSTLYEVGWVQDYQGIPIQGTRVKDWGGDVIVEESSFTFDLYPPTGELMAMYVLGSHWYVVPPSFGLSVQPSQAVSIAVGVASSQLNMSQISYTNVAFVVVQGHLYYYVSVRGGESRLIQYSIYVNPRTGEVGFPS